MTVRIAQCYPRALSGDGGMTGAVMAESFTWSIVARCWLQYIDQALGC